jgi:hypothetical protein
MTAALETKPQHTVDPLLAFRARCDARAHLVAAGEYDLVEAFDELQADAVKSGLVAEYGQDLIQTLMAAALRQYPRAAIIAEPREITETRPTATPWSTVEALLYGLRRGLSCLDDPSNRDRLARCDAAAMKEISARLLDMKARSKGARADWSKEDVGTLISVWRAMVERSS